MLLSILLSNFFVTYYYSTLDAQTIKHSDFVTTSYGESWDSSSEKSRVPPQKETGPTFSGLYVTRQLICRQTPNLCITVY